MKKIICIGEALIDMICTDKGKALSDGDHFLKKAGGAPTNVAAAIAALGGDVELVATVGADPFGKKLWQKFHWKMQALCILDPLPLFYPAPCRKPISNS